MQMSCQSTKWSPVIGWCPRTKLPILLTLAKKRYINTLPFLFPFLLLMFDGGFRRLSTIRTDWRIDGQTDGRTELLIHYRAVHSSATMTRDKKFCRNTVVEKACTRRITLKVTHGHRKWRPFIVFGSSSASLSCNVYEISPLVQCRPTWLLWPSEVLQRRHHI